jgi:cobalt-zinc-cadmium efflux system outer membrane protein
VRRPSLRSALAIPGLLATLGGCAAAPSPAAIEPVQAVVIPRLGQPVQWIRGEPEDAPVREAIRALLAAPLTAEAAVQADLLQAGRIENPVAAGEARFGRGTEVTLDVVQDLLSVVTRSARRTIATAAFERAQLELGRKILAVAAEVRAAYYRLVADAEALGLLRQVATATEAAAELAERQVQAGALSRRDQALQQTLYAQVVLELARAETQARGAAGEFLVG